MRINKKKFFVRMFILISVIGLLIYARFLSVNDGWNDIITYYEGLISSLKENKSTYLIAEKTFSVPTDKTLKNTIIGRNDGVVVVNNNGLKEYNISTEPYWTLDFYFANPLLAVANNWTAIAELNGTKIKVFDLKNEIYNLELEGQIQKIVLNEKGYLGIIYNKVGYKNAFAFVGPDGQILYTKYFANTTLVDISINNDGNIISMIEADANSAVINSAITYLDDKGNTLYSSIKKDKLLVETKIFDNQTVVLGDNVLLNINNNYEENMLEEFDNENIFGVVIEDEKIVKMYRDTNELFSDKTMIEIKKIDGKVIGNGEVTGTAKSLKVQGKTIAVVLADRIDFLTTKGNYMDSIFISSDYIDMKLFKNGSYACIQTNDEIAIYKIR